MKLFMTLSFLFILDAILGQDCNSNYDTLQDLKMRATSNEAGNGPYRTDSSLVKQWYNVGSNNMPNNSASLYLENCGTLFPIWMKGPVPDVSDGSVTRTACIMGYVDECESEVTIEVKNCATKMLYKLSPTGISTSYCFDPINPPIFRPEVITVQPGLIFRDTTDVLGQPYKKPELVFRCDFKESSIDMFYYTVSWNVNEEALFIRQPVLFSAIHTTNLYENELIAKGKKLDISIHCIVRSSLSINGPLSGSAMSNRYWLGVKVIHPNINIKPNDTATVELQPTFPIGCSSPVNIPYPRSTCSMLISMFDPDDQYDCTDSSVSVHDSQKCGISFPAFYHDEWTPTSSYGDVKYMTITTKQMTKYHPSRSVFKLKLATQGTGFNDIAQNYILAGITVTVYLNTDWQGKWCYSYVDPHMLTFDGIPYENQNLGTFVMYRHKSMKQEVQMHTKQCNWYATCACAVAVRAGGDLFIMDLCESPRIIKHVSCKEGILDVRQEGSNQYTIYMPLGTVVSVSINTWWDDSTLNIVIYPSMKDVFATSGLCGVLGRGQGDDFTTPLGTLEWDNNLFSTSWRIDRAQSYFDTTNQNPDVWNANDILCVCPAAITSTIAPGVTYVSSLTPLCSPSVYLSCTKQVNLPGASYICNIRTKRSTYSMTRETERILSRRARQAETQKHHSHHEKRSTLQIAFKDAYEQCERFFATNCPTSLYEDSIPKSNLNSKNNSITNCALDYTYIGNMSLANLHCELYRSEVEQEIRRNNTFREVSPDVVQSFRATACINNCNNHGDCVNGTCICHVSYIEGDCSVSQSDYPIVDDTYSGGLCKMDQDECCGSVPIYGSRFVKGITKQKVERFELYIDRGMIIKDTIVNDLSIVNLFEAEINVTCEARARRSTNSDSNSTRLVTGIRVSLSNDGINFGSAQNYYMYDSRCQSVSNDTNGYIFFILNGTCFISDTCYFEGDLDPMDNCNRCRPSENPYSWTNECGSTRHNRPSPSEWTLAENATTNITFFTISPTVSANVSSNPSNSNNNNATNNNNSSGSSSSVNQSLDSTILIISLCVGVVLVVSTIAVIVIIKRCCFKPKRISVKSGTNVEKTMPSKNKLDKNELFFSQQSLREHAENKNQDDSLHHDNLWKYRPGTPGAISVKFN